MKSILLLGTNLGNKQNNLKLAIGYVLSNIGNILCKSSIYESEPWGFNSKELFYNMAIEVDTKLSPIVLLKKINEIEIKMGRVKNFTNCYENRLIDIDILFYEDIIMNTSELIIPHPKLHLRKFTLMPLNEINKKFVHPILKKEISNLLLECNDNTAVVNIGIL